MSQWTGPDQDRYGEYCYDCLYCRNVFGYRPGSGPITGWGNMGTSYGVSIQCPRCGSTNTSGPRLVKPGERVARYPATKPDTYMPGLDYFTNQESLWVDPFEEASSRQSN